MAVEQVSFGTCARPPSQQPKQATTITSRHQPTFRHKEKKGSAMVEGDYITGTFLLIEYDSTEDF